MDEWPDWSERARTVVGDDPYRRANARIVERVANGIGLDSGTQRAGVRVVVDVAPVHVPAILADGYRNAYDLARARRHRLGDDPPTEAAALRLGVDRAVAETATRLLARDAGTAWTPTVAPEDLYYCAIELNGTGVRYFGEFCLVLGAGPDDAAFPLVLARNSFDLEREPLRSSGGTLAERASGLAGTAADAADILVTKLFASPTPTDRLLTTGIVGRGVLDDEDYVEVPRVGSFGAGELAEVRTRAEDAAVEAAVIGADARGHRPSLAAQKWVRQRRAAAVALREAGIPVRIVTTPGRTSA